MVGPSQDPRRPTFGQAVQLERISTAAWVLCGERLERQRQPRLFEPDGDGSPGVSEG